jgi:glycosyltransferase involved in cell wall biosynthesis
LVSAIIPARNEEASIARAVESVVAQPEIGEVIVVDDESTDGTAAILKDLASRLPKLSMLPAGDLPVGWVGKNHALAVGAAVAKGDWLLFTDADTLHLPGTMRRALADAVEHDAVLVSYSPEQEMETWWERALILQIYWMLSKRYTFEKVNDSALPDAAANGQFILVRRDVYESVGGHRAVADEILEDVAVARLVKRAGSRLYFATGLGIVRTRMYRSFGAMWEGWTKNLYALLGKLELVLLRELASGLVFAGAILICVLSTGDLWKWIVLTAGIVWFAVRMDAFGRYLRENQYPASDIQYFVPGVFLYSAALIASRWKSARGRVEWKGRRYGARLSEQEAGSSLHSK